MGFFGDIFVEWGVRYDIHAVAQMWIFGCIDRGVGFGSEMDTEGTPDLFYGVWLEAESSKWEIPDRSGRGRILKHDALFQMCHDYLNFLRRPKS
jgi:hypothetical protein